MTFEQRGPLPQFLFSKHFTVLSPNGRTQMKVVKLSQPLQMNLILVLFGQWMSGRLPSAECNMLSSAFDLDHTCVGREKTQITHITWTHDTRRHCLKLHIRDSLTTWPNIIAQSFENRYIRNEVKDKQISTEILLQPLIVLVFCLFLKYSSTMPLLQKSSQLLLHFFRCSASDCVGDAI